MFEAQPDQKPYRTVEIIDLFSDPDFVTALGNLETRINAFSDTSAMDAEDLEAEKSALDAFNKRYFNLEWWLERPAEVVAAANAGQNGDNDSLNIASFRAKLACVAPDDYKDSVIIDRTYGIHMQQPAHRSLSLRFIDESGEVITIPLNKDTLLSCKVDTLVPQNPELNLTSRLRYANAVFQNLLQSSMFLGLTLEEQQEYIEDIITRVENEISCPSGSTDNYEVLATNPEGNGVDIYQANILSISFPNYKEREVPYRNLQDFAYGTSLWLDVIDTRNKSPGAVPMDSVINVANVIQEQAPQDIGPTADMLTTFFADDDFIYLFNQIKNRINVITDPVEQAQAIEDAVAELDDRFADKVNEKLYRYKGTAYCDKGLKGAYVPFNIQASECYGEGFDIQFINGSWQITLPLQIDPSDAPAVPTLPDEQLIIFHVLPYSTRNQLLEQYQDAPDEQAIQTGAICRDHAAQTNRLIKSKMFRQAALGKQLYFLKEAVASFVQSIDDLNPPDDMMFDCQCSEYYVVDSELAEGLVGMTPSDIAELGHTRVALEGEQSVRTISGVLADIKIPEVHDIITDDRLKISDFVLSKGEPMLIIVDSDTSLTYFIPAGSVQALAPRYISAPTQD